MATTVAGALTLEEFRTRYADSDRPHFEYWFGEAIQKTVPTWLHSLLQGILVNLLTRAGYKAGSELEMRIDPGWQPKADVAAALVVEQPYPTRPIDIVAEILSPEDRMVRVFEKCRNYDRIGISKVFVLDPETRRAWEWRRETDNLERVSALHLPNGTSIPSAAIWDELDRLLV